MNCVACWLVAAIATNVSFVPAASCQQVQSCAVLGLNVQLTEEDILKDRIPENKIGSPNSCAASMNATIAGWQAEDKSAFETLANRECSARAGWAEYHPGTCQAGGPPPICKVNHWYQNFITARQQADAMNKEVLTRRQATLKSVACRCWASAINSDTSSISVANSTGNSVCPYQCAPGQSCRAGSCMVSAEDPEDAGRFTEDQLKGIIDKLAEQYGGALGEFYGSPSTAGVLAFMDPTLLSTYSKAYRQALSHINRDLRQIADERDSLKRAAGGSYNGRTRPQILLAIEDDQAGLEKDIDLSSDYYQGVVTENELPSTGCYEVLEASHKRLIGLAGHVARLSSQAIGESSAK